MNRCSRRSRPRPQPRRTRWKSVEAGAATTVWAATSTSLDGIGGRYLEDCGIAAPDDDPGAERGHRSYATNPERAAALWTLSEQLVGLDD